MTTQQNAALVQLTGKNCREVLAQQAIVLVECWASHCGACAIFDPIYSGIAKDYPQHTFAKLDTQVREVDPHQLE